MGANERQVGGGHYSGEYQHWDFVEDAGLRYVPGNATKYVARWRKKNGRQDLEKAIHYLDKAIEKRILAPLWDNAVGPLEKFIENNDLLYHERAVLTCIVMGDYTRAKILVEGHLLPLASIAEAVENEPA